MCCAVSNIFLFFFSSRRRHTRWPRDWSSDVCSSDLIDFLHDPIPRPTLFEVLGPYKNIAFIGRVQDILGQLGHPQRRTLGRSLPNSLRIFQTLCLPLGHTLQLNAPNHRLHLGHAPVSPKALMQPSKAWGVLTMIDRIVVLAVVF